MNKKIWTQIRDVIDNTAKKYDDRWRKRIKKSGGINSKFLINFIFQLAINTKKGYGVVLSELWADCGSKNIKMSQSSPFSISSICEARQKLPEDIFLEINLKIREVSNIQERKLFMGKHRVYAIDGTKVSLDKRLEAEGYKIYNKDAYYPSGLLSCLYDVNNYIACDFRITKNMSERKVILKHIDVLKKDDLVILDRGYFSYFLLRKFVNKGIHVLFRLQKNLKNKELDKFLSSNETDAIINYKPSQQVKYRLKVIESELDFSPIPLRVLKQEINDKTYIFGTTLIGIEYKEEIFSDLYHSRWSIEELYKISKETFGIEALHAKTERGIKQEIYAHFVLINIARFIEMESNKNQGIKMNMKKTNFKGCVVAINSYINELMFKGYSYIIKIIKKILTFISKMKYKVRPNRCFPRVSHKPVKRWRIAYNS